MKVAFIGSRGHLGYVFNELPVLPELEVCALCSAGDAPERLTVNLEKIGYTAPLFEDYRELIDTAKPDIAVVSGPWHLHAEMSEYALSRGWMFSAKNRWLSRSKRSMLWKRRSRPVTVNSAV